MKSLALGSADLASRILDATRHFTRQVKRVVGTPWTPDALSRAEVDVVRHLRLHPGCSVNEVAEALHVAPNTVSTLVRALLGKGIVRRSVDPADRRVSRLDLTPEARARVEGWRDERAVAVGEALSRLGDADCRALASAVGALQRLAIAMGEDPNDVIGDEDPADVVGDEGAVIGPVGTDGSFEANTRAGRVIA